MELFVCNVHTISLTRWNMKLNAHLNMQFHDTGSFSET